MGCKIYDMAKVYRHGRPTIGVLIGWRLSWTSAPYSYLTPIFQGIAAAVHDQGCNLLLACGVGSQTDISDMTTRPAWPTLAGDVDFAPVGAWNTDGLIVVNPLVSETRSKYIHGLMETGHPVILIAESEGKPAIVADNAGGISQALSHFIEHGHKRIAFIGGNPGDTKGDSGERLRAYQASLQQFGLSMDPALLTYGYHNFEGGYTAMQQTLRSGAEFTAVLASNDESAIGAMQALKEAGLKIPEDVAVIGFDDRQEAPAQNPPLTSVHVPLYKLGYQAVEVLLQLLHGQKDAARSFKVATHLVIRQSCGCRQDAGIASAMSAKSMQSVDANIRHAHIVQSIVETVLAQTQHFDRDEVRIMCDRLVNAFISSIEKGDPADFQQMLDELIVRVALAGDEAHIWQPVISSLRLGMPILLDSVQSPSAYQVALDILGEARNVISERMQRQHAEHVINQKWRTSQIGHLTNRFLLTSNEAQILEVLSSELPVMGIKRASLSFFEMDGDDPVGWSVLHLIPDNVLSPIRFPTRQFPPQGLYPLQRAFSLVVVPLVCPTGQVGIIAYDSTDIELAGAITQQVAAALNNARLYAQATEGRKLAEEANNLKSRFLSMVSHELRTPLNLVVGLSEILLQKHGLGARLLPISFRKDIEQIYASAQHLGRLIRDVLDLAGSQAGTLHLANELLDLGDTLEMVSATGRQLANDKGLTWRDVFPETRLWVWGDRTRLRQVALNLVSNAVKFTERGEVSLQVEVKNGKVIVLVSDTGVGITRDEHTLIFDEFRRSEQALARGYGGLGLGLAISKRLVEMHGGEIGVESSGQEGAGSTFYFILPLIEPEAIRGEDQLLPLGSEEIVLLLTNQSGSGERLRDHLVQKGLEVNMVQIDQVGDWFSPLLKNLPGAVVLDTAIVPTQGWNVLKMLKENPATRTIPLLFYSLTKNKGAMLELDYLTKPVEMGELAQALEHRKRALDSDKTEKVFLIVDDDPATLEMHVRIVQSRLGEQHEVLKAHNGREALELMQQRRPDLVLLDLMMPGLNGFEVLEAMRGREATRDISVIVLTGQMLTEKEMARLNRGVTTVLEKGLFSAEETLAHIDAALARKRKLGGEARRLVRQAMAYLHEHYADPISREDLANHLGMSSDYLSACFRVEVGMAPIAYLNRYRVNQAKGLLRGSEKSITEIALAVGFSNSNYFGRVFRRQVGVPPEVYRRS